MTDYQVYTLHSGGLTLGNHMLRSETDDAARAFCRQCLPEGGMAELWNNERRVDLIWVTAQSAKSAERSESAER